MICEIGEHHRILSIQKRIQEKQWIPNTIEFDDFLEEIESVRDAVAKDLLTRILDSHTLRE